MIKIGVVSFLNTLPLIYGMDNNLVRNNFQLIRDVPSRLADDLRDQILDLALIPAIEYAKSREDYGIVPNICIGADGPVKSVSLFFRKEISDIKNVALDTSSRTSVALAKIILAEKFDIHPTYIDTRPNLENMLQVADAAVLIGDVALEAGAHYSHWIDLAEEWKEWTGYPFVFAVWAGRKDEWNLEQLAPFYKSKELGIKNIDKIATEYASGHNHSREFYQTYLQDHIQYDLSEDHIEGLKAFWEMAFYHGLTEQIPDIDFFRNEGSER